SSDVGVCLQAYLHRTADDVDSLMPLGPSIRLVKGAYREAPEIALPKKVLIDQNYLRLSDRLLADRKTGRLRRFAAATHDLKLITKIIDAAARAGLAPKVAYEIQMLY